MWGKKSKDLSKNDVWKDLKQVVDRCFETTKEDRKRWGNYYDQFLGKIWDEDKLKENNSRAFINMIFSTVMSTAPMITDSRPIGSVVPRKPYLERLAWAYNAGLKYAWNILDLQKKVLLAAIDGMVMGTGIFKVYFDKEKTFGGELAVDVIDPRDFFIAQGYDEIWKAPMCGERADKPLTWVKKMFPDVEEIKPTSSVFDSDSMAKVIKFPNAQSFELDSYFVRVYEVWLRDEEALETLVDADGQKIVDENGKPQKIKKFPNGKYVYFTDNQFLGEYAADTEHGLPCWVEFKNIEIPHMFPGMGEAVQIEGLNKELNLQLQAVLDHSRDYHKPNIIVDGSQMDSEDVEQRWTKGGQLFTKSGVSNNPAVEFPPAPQLNPSVFQLFTMIPQVIEEISGVTDVMKGQEGKRERQSASEIAILMESSHTRTRQRVRNMEWSIKRLNYLLVRLMMQYYTEPRTINYTNENNEIVYEILGNSKAQAEEMLRPPESVIQKAAQSGNIKRDLDPSEQEAYEDYQRFVEAFHDTDDADPVFFEFDIEIQTNSTLPLDKQSQANLMLRLAQMKVIDPPALLEQLQIPNWQAIVERMEKKQQEAAQAKGRPPGGSMPGSQGNPAQLSQLPPEMQQAIQQQRGGQ